LAVTIYNNNDDDYYYYYYYLQLGCHPVAVVILHVYGLYSLYLRLNLPSTPDLQF